MSEKLIARIGALLEKAESSEFGPEAEALIAKAQELASMHAIDLAVARAGRIQKKESLIQRRIEVWPRGKVGGKYQVWLFGVVAAVNDVEHDVSMRSEYVIAFGYPSDIDATEQLFGSLQVQMVAGAAAGLKAGEHKSAGVDARVWRGSFYDGFRESVGARLRDGRAAALAERSGTSTGTLDEEDESSAERAEAARAALGAGGAELVLAEKSASVGKFHRETSDARGHWRASSPSAHSSAGRAAGAAAGRRARLSSSGELPGARAALY